MTSYTPNTNRQAVYFYQRHHEECQMLHPCDPSPQGATQVTMSMGNKGRTAQAGSQVHDQGKLQRAQTHRMAANAEEHEKEQQ